MQFDGLATRHSQNRRNQRTEPLLLQNTGRVVDQDRINVVGSGKLLRLVGVVSIGVHG